MMAMAAPRPKSPPDTSCGRHRLQLAVDMFHHEIRFLEGDINSIEGLLAASKCYKEVDEFIGKNDDPFITISSKKGNTDQSHHFPKKIRARTCLSYLSWICCCGGCASGCSTIQLKGPSCCCCSGPCRAGSPCLKCSCGCTCSSSCSPACCGGVPRCCLC